MADLKYKEDSFEVIKTFNRPNNTTAYTIGDAITNSTTNPTYITFEGISGQFGESSVIDDVHIRIQAASPTPTLTLYLFNSPPTATNDNSAFTLSASDQSNIETIVVFGTGGASSFGTTYFLRKTSTINRFRGGWPLVYGLLQASTTFTPSALDEIWIKIIGHYV